MYSREAGLVDDFVKHLPNSAFSRGGTPRLIKEFDYSRGRADIVILTESGEISAFEAKLTRWRDALHQAYRNKCFAHYSYIVLPEAVAKLAAQYGAEFSERAVGICYIRDGEICIVQESQKSTPVEEWLSKRAHKALLGEESEWRSQLI